VDCHCKESFEVFSAVRVSQLMYAFVCKHPAFNLVFFVGEECAR
jgi:hypothetical protein